MKIYFDSEIDGERVPLFIMKVNKEGMHCVFQLWRDVLNPSETEQPIFLGEISVENLLKILNRDKLTCKYGHSVEVGKRNKQRRTA